MILAKSLFNLRKRPNYRHQNQSAGDEETASGQVLRSAVFYDNKYRPVQTVSENYAGGGTTRISTRFSFDGLPEAVLETQIFGSATNTIAKRMEYDHARRLLKEYHKINAQTEILLTENVYDELGKLKTKKQNTVETVNYAYNIRDWLTSAKASKFAIDLTYNFNGNIATQIAAGGNYAYTYDAANRLTAGTHSGGFTENGITYDANGNIATLNRVGTSPGAFAYSYTGNKLTSLKVNTTPYAYTYDANGNATKDGYRGMELQYNLLNLPRKVSKVAGTGSVEYVYLASGAKLAKKVNGVFTQFYNGSVVYKGDKTAEYISTSEGLAMKTASGFAYQYNLSDHLGNVRVVLNQDKSVAQSTNYYPFGLAHATSALDKNKYLYNGKEIQSDVIGGTPFGMLDYGARFYDPVIGRWHSIDPLASKYAGLSGYNYVGNNPMKFIDPDGKSVWLTEGANGTYSVLGGDLNDKDRNMYVYKDGVRGQSIGITTSTTSFYDSDKEVWAVGSVINPNDKSGDNFLNSIFENNPPMLDDYMAKAGNGGIYDFKATNGESRTTENLLKESEYYRGMPIGKTGNGITIYSSARDIGNIAAGYIAGSNGMSWTAARVAFDTYQTKVNKWDPSIEGISTRNAEYYGFCAGSNIYPAQKSQNLGNSLIGAFKKLWK